MFPKDFFVRNLDAAGFRDNFLISAIVSVFTIRIFLRITGYPQLGNGQFHIAHLLWGGFFMLLAFIIIFSFITRESLSVASIFGGIGFGTFIDELGKFITRDNDYFFQPTIAIIYIIFVLVYVILRSIPRVYPIAQKEYLINAIDMIKEAAVNDFDIEEERRARRYLKLCDPKDPLVKELTDLLSHIDAIPNKKPGIVTRFRNIFRSAYEEVAESNVLLKGIILYLSVSTVITIIQTVGLFLIHPHLPFAQWGKLYSSFLAAILVVIGLIALRFSRAEAYRFFHLAMLVTICLTEFFAFMYSQWFELFNLGANIFIFMVINYAMVMEREKNKLERV